MIFCTMCGEKCGDAGELGIHQAQHYRGPKDPESFRPLPTRSVSQAFERAFGREASPEELDRIIAGEAEAVYSEAAAALS